jgi:hypothetical protein
MDHHVSHTQLSGERRPVLAEILATESEADTHSGRLL